MKRIVISVGLALGVLSGVVQAAEATNAVSQAPASWRLDGVAAQVNGETITIAEVMNEIRNSAWIELSPEERDAQLRKLYGETLNAFIDRKLILAAAKAEERKLQGWVVDDREREIIDSRFGGDRTKLMSMLSERRILYNDWRQGIEEDLMLSAMRMEFVDKRIGVSPRDIRGYYETNRVSLHSPAGVRVGLITLTVLDQDETVAQYGARALKDLDGGADFAATARKFSKDAHADQGGDWGFLDPAEKLAPPLVKALSELKCGEYSRLVELGGRGYIIKKVEEKQAVPLSLEDAWQLIDRRLRAQQGDALYRDWINRLRRRAFVRIFDLPASPSQP